MPRRSHIAAALGLVLLVGCAGPNTSSSASTTSLAPLASTLATHIAPNASVPATQVPGPSAPPVAGEAPTLTLEPVVSGLDAPLDVAVRPADPEAMYVAEQAGRVRVVRDGVVAATPYLDITGQVQAGGERGLLGIAFHPDPEDGRLFVYYTALDGAQVLSSFGSTLDADAADPESETMILRMEDQFGNHNGGALSGLTDTCTSGRATAAEPETRSDRAEASIRCSPRFSGSTSIAPGRTAPPTGSPWTIPTRMDGGHGPRSGPPGSAIPGGSASIGGRTTCGSVTSGRARARRSMSRPQA